MCNDIAVADNGTAYASDTAGAKIFMLKKGATALERCRDPYPLWQGVDGVAFGDKSRVVCEQRDGKGRLIKLELGADGKATKVTELKLSGPLGAPDGLRAIGKK